jgi:hypothetical protein
VLDEWSDGTPSTVKLESKHYVKVYNTILNSMETVGDDDYYGPLLRQRLAAWAGFGEYVFSFHSGLVRAMLIITPDPSAVALAHQPIFQSTFTSTSAAPPNELSCIQSLQAYSTLSNRRSLSKLSWQSLPHSTLSPVNRST